MGPHSPQPDDQSPAKKPASMPSAPPPTPQKRFEAGVNFDTTRPQSLQTTPSTSLPPRPQPMPLEPAASQKQTVLKSIKGLFSFLLFIATVIIAAMLINNFVFQSYYVEGTSMTPTLQNEDRLIIDKLGKTGAALSGQFYIPKRGDIVVLDSTLLDQFGHEEQLIKRVIGLPGDTIIIKDGAVTIKNDGSPEGFNVDQNLGLQLNPTYSELPIEVTVPDGHVYVLGDNRGINGSFDSRSFGMVASKNIQGRLAMRIFPFNHAQFF